MSFKVQITPITGTMLSRAGVGFQTQQLVNALHNDLADEAKRVIRKMQEYPGETQHARYRTTGVLQFKTLLGTVTNRRGQLMNQNTVERGEYQRTGQLGLAWDYDIKNSVGGGLTLIFTNVAHDRPGNYYAGWVNGFNKVEARGIYHQAEWHKDSGWANFSDELSKTEIAKAAQDSIDDYLRNAGLM